MKEGEAILVKIVEAISERLEVKYSIRTTTKSEQFQGSTFTVMRTHGEFEWLFSSLAENPKYWGFIIPGKPEKSDMGEIRARFGQLAEFKEMNSHDEFVREKDEVTAEYLAEFKRTVVRHELFLKRIVEHPALSADGDLQLFLTFPGQLEHPNQSSGKLINFFKAIYKTDDSSLLSIKDSDCFFETKKNFVLDYLPKLQASGSLRSSYQYEFGAGFAELYISSIKFSWLVMYNRLYRKYVEQTSCLRGSIYFLCKSHN